jgi:hypothetical protein
MKVSVMVAALLCIVWFTGCKPRQKLSRCGAVEDLNAQIKKNPAIQLRGDSIERITVEYLRKFNHGEENEASLRGGRIIIPVVVHVLYNNSSSDPTNIPDIKINEQLDRLNADFRRANTDAGSVPADFSGVAADSRIEFQLCKRDPSCNPTTGITRTQVTGTSFSPHNAKFTSTGGVDAWNTAKYLNIWVVPSLCLDDGTMCGTLLGSASFPSFPSNEYGFVAARQFVGNTTDPNYNLGRTAVHEFGHFYNLKHIWGDAHCGDDMISDTPPAEDKHFSCTAGCTGGCFTHPYHVNLCGTGLSPNGEMTMDYMDYTDDGCMYMFTQGQVDRMVATLYTTMSGLLSSDALIPPPTSSSADLFIGDTPEDIGNEPNNESDVFYTSQDIWVRNTNDGLMNMEHQNPIYRPSGPSNFVYVRIRNRGCQTATSANVKLYWAKASTGLGWPDPWNGGVLVGSALMGNIVDTKPSGTVTGGNSTVLEYAWTPPNPADYSAFGADQAHFCLLARIEPPSVTETSDLGDNVRNNNNIAWKNVEVATTGGGSRQASTLLENYDKKAERFSIGFRLAKGEESPFRNYDSVFIQLSPREFQNWKANGSKGENIVADQNRRIRLLNASATISGITLKYREVEPVNLEFSGTRRKGPHVYFLDVLQFNDESTPKKMVGAQRIWVKSFIR